MKSDLFYNNNCENILYIKNSLISGLGCYTNEVIPADTLIVEYKGELISAEDAFKREADLSRPGIYTFWVNEEMAIDGCDKGNIARYINHSCDPNCYYIFRNNRIFILASRDITADEELTIDYCYDSEGEKVTCSCGSEKCRGFINNIE